MPFTYIIYSPTRDKYYTGACNENLNSRIQKHNSAFYGKTHFTASASDWIVFLSVSTQTYQHAIRLERKIKAMKSRKYIENLKKYPELLHKIFLETEVAI
jgi:putative endonuclease